MRNHLVPLAIKMVVAMAVSLLLGNIASAKSLYVTDKISIDIYSQGTAGSKPVDSLPTGTIVKVLDKDNGYTHIRTANDVEGWVESKYLSNEKPAQIAYNQLATKYQSLQHKLHDYQAKVTQMGELRKEVQTVDWLRNKLTDYRQSQQDLQNQLRVKDIAIAELKINAANLQDKLNAALKQLADSGHIVSTAAREDAYTDTESSSLLRPRSVTGFYTWLALSLAVTLIIGVLMGFVLIDYNTRRKQGDFKFKS
ncbi:MAG: TIGR04211 family SH3 domain-containing protein [Gammaproteobacteria bacterium]|jgi:SH3 domain protein